MNDLNDILCHEEMTERITGVSKMVMTEHGICPRCGNACERDEVDVGVGTVYGPFGCPCGWSEWERYDSIFKTMDNVDTKGGYWPKRDGAIQPSESENVIYAKKGGVLQVYSDVNQEFGLTQRRWGMIENWVYSRLNRDLLFRE